MNSFHSVSHGKEFLIAKIVAEAQRENIELSEVERKMLDFSEDDSLQPDMTAIDDEFNRAYDQDEYEKKITRLIKKAYKQIWKGPHAEYDDWWSAIRLLKTEDHYLSVLIDKADVRRRGDSAKLLGAAISIVAVVVGLAFLSAKYSLPFDKYKNELYGFLWIAVLVVAVPYTILRMILGNKRIDDFAVRIIRIIFHDRRVK